MWDLIVLILDYCLSIYYDNLRLELPILIYLHYKCNYSTSTQTMMFATNNSIESRGEIFTSYVHMHYLGRILNAELI